MPLQERPEVRSGIPDRTQAHKSKRIHTALLDLLCWLPSCSRRWNLKLLVVDWGGLQAELQRIFGNASIDEGVLRADFVQCMEALLDWRAGTDDDRIRQIFKAFDVRCERCTTSEPSCPRRQPSLRLCYRLLPLTSSLCPAWISRPPRCREHQQGGPRPCICQQHAAHLSRHCQPGARPHV